jgi:ABC-2 type transport system ATP-binding protein
LHEPKLLILDEPFSGLDPVNSNLIKEEIFKLAKNGTTVIFSTHRMEQVEEICDHIILINKGTKILDGTVKQIKQDCKENKFKVGFENVPEIHENELFNVVETLPDNIIIKLHEGVKPMNVLQYLIGRNASINSFNEILPSINDIFISKVEDTKLSRQFETVH